MHPTNLSAVDLNLLAVLSALLDERSVSRAARRLGLSQPATSHALKRLREMLGDELLVRVGRAMVPTPRALELAPLLAEAMVALSKVVAGPAPFDPRTAERSFRIAAADLQQVVLFPRLVARLSKDAPRFDLVIDPSGLDMSARVASLELDLAIGLVRASSRAAQLRTRALFSDGFVSLARKGHPLLEGKMDVRRFAAAPHAFIAPGGARGGGAVDEALRALGTSRRIAFQAAQFLVAPYIVAETDLVITLPEQAARLFSRRLPLVLFRPPVKLPRFEISMVWHERFEDEPSHRFLREEIVRVSKPVRS